MSINIKCMCYWDKICKYYRDSPLWSQRCINSCSATHIFNTNLHNEIFLLFRCV